MAKPKVADITNSNVLSTKDAASFKNMMSVPPKIVQLIPSNSSEMISRNSNRSFLELRNIKKATEHSEDKMTHFLCFELYNLKNYKKALKVADSLLSRYPEHGETMSIKALLTLFLEPSRESDILNMAKRALTNDENSYLCWHVMGMIYKNMKRYMEAVKCFIMALRIDPLNDRLLKDICCLEIELNDYSAFRRFSSNELQLRSKEYREWAVFAFSHHLCGNLSMSSQILEEADELFINRYGVESYELSEAMLYRGMLYELTGEFEACIKLLVDKEHLIKDRIFLYELKAKVAYLAKNYKLSHECYKILLEENPDNAKYALMFIATHEDAKHLFYKISYPKAPNRGSIYQKQMRINSNNVKYGIFDPVESDTICAVDTAVEKSAPNGSDTTNPASDGIFHNSNEVKGGIGNQAIPGIMLSNEVLDLDGDFSSAGWLNEYKLYHNFDLWVTGQRTNKYECKDNLIFDNCSDYREYVNNVGCLFNLNELPDPKTLTDGQVLTVLDEYLRDYPRARYTVYTRHRKLQRSDNYPIVIFTREITREESKALLNVLKELKDNFLLNCLVLIFSRGEDFIKSTREILLKLIHRGNTNIFKQFLHVCTFENCYILVHILEEFMDKLRSGDVMENLNSDDNSTLDIDEIATKMSELSVKDRIPSDTQHSVMCEYKLVIVGMILSKVYTHLGDYKNALRVLEGLFEISPTCIPLYCVRGKLYKHLGNFLDSNRDFKFAADIDKSERQTNSKAAKALLRINEFDISRRKWRTFLLEDRSAIEEKDEPMEITSFKYELMYARRYLLLYNATNDVELLYSMMDIYIKIIEKNNDIYIGQMDFHNYCLNRLALRTYYNFLNMRNNYASQSYFIKSVKGLFNGMLELQRLGLIHKNPVYRIKTKCDNILFSPANSSLSTSEDQFKSSDTISGNANLQTNQGNEVVEQDCTSQDDTNKKDSKKNRNAKKNQPIEIEKLGDVEMLDNLKYCSRIMMIVLSQRVYDGGLYVLFYKFAKLLNLSFYFKLQCVIRVYYTGKCNNFNYKLYPLIFDLLYSTDLEALTIYEQSLFYKTLGVLLNWTDLKYINKSLKDVALEYFKIILETIKKPYIKHVFNLTLCVYNINDTLYLLDAIYKDFDCAQHTFNEYAKAFNKFTHIVNTCTVGQNRAFLNNQRNSLIQSWTNTFKDANFNIIKLN